MRKKVGEGWVDARFVENVRFIHDTPKQAADEIEYREGQHRPVVKVELWQVEESVNLYTPWSQSDLTAYLNQ